MKGFMKGPWFARKAPLNGDKLWVQNGPGCLLADCHTNHTIPLETANANATLMAASPELLDALREIVAVCTHKTLPYGSHPAMLRAKAALAKAEGLS